MTQPAPIHAFDAPPAYLQIKNWLGAERVAWLLDYAQERQALFRPSRVLNPEGPAVDPSVRKSHILKRAPELAEQIESRVRESLPQIWKELGTGAFQPIDFETELVAHGDGARFAMHRDIGPGKPNDRIVSGVYYFHREPKGFSGGALRLYSQGESKRPGTFADIEPENDSIVFFPSWIPHEVLPVRCPSGSFMDARFAVNCWLHR